MIGKKKYALFVFVAIIFTCPGAWALDLTVDAGMSSYVKQADGTWYQDGVGPTPTLRLQSPTFGIGLTGPIMRHLSWSVSYEDMGSFRSDSWDTTDQNYIIATRSERNPSLPLYHFQGTGSAQAWVAALQPGITLHHVHLFAQLGLMLNRYTWTEHVSIPGQFYLLAAHRARWMTSYELGAGLRVRHFFALWQYLPLSTNFALPPIGYADRRFTVGIAVPWCNTSRHLHGETPPEKIILHRRM